MKYAFRYINYVGLLLLTAFAVLGMFWLNYRIDQSSLDSKTVDPLPESSAPKQRVAVEEFVPKVWPVYGVYSGKVYPWETHHVSFEAAGRIRSLGVNARGEPLDEGDEVQAGQVLAEMDDRVLVARKDEAAAALELAITEYNRAARLRETGSKAITDTEFTRRSTASAQAKALYAIAVKNLEDARVLATVPGTISKRFKMAGESVNPHEPVFEIIEHDPIKLIVNVPESEILSLQTRMRGDKRIEGEEVLKPLPSYSRDRGPVEIPVQIFLQGKDAFGQPWPRFAGTVHQISQVAAMQTGLFEVEIRIDNPDQRLRPGLVATAWIELDRVEGYKLPESVLVSRRGKTQVFKALEEAVELEAMYWNVGSADLHRVESQMVDRMIDQRPLPDEDIAALGLAHSNQSMIIIPSDSKESLQVVVRGQHRLTPGQLVRVVNAGGETNKVTEASHAGIEASATEPVPSL